MHRQSRGPPHVWTAALVCGQLSCCRPPLRMLACTAARALDHSSRVMDRQSQKRNVCALPCASPQRSRSSQLLARGLQAPLDGPASGAIAGGARDVQRFRRSVQLSLGQALDSLTTPGGRSSPTQQLQPVMAPGPRTTLPAFGSRGEWASESGLSTITHPTNISQVAFAASGHDASHCTTLPKAR